MDLASRALAALASLSTPRPPNARNNDTPIPAGVLSPRKTEPIRDGTATSHSGSFAKPCASPLVVHRLPAAPILAPRFPLHQTAVAIVVRSARHDPMSRYVVSSLSSGGLSCESMLSLRTVAPVVGSDRESPIRRPERDTLLISIFRAAVKHVGPFPITS